MAGYLGASPVPQTIQKKQSFTATASQTTFTTTGYTDGQFINVYLNGVRLINGTDYTATNGSDIVLTTGASASDVLDFETFNEFTLVDQTLETPTFRTSATLKNDTEEDTDGGRESTLIFKGEQSGGEISTLAEIEASHDGTSDDEKGDLIFRTNDGSDGASPTERLRINSDGVIDATSTNTDSFFFRSSHSTNTNLYITNTNATTSNTASLNFAPANNVTGASISALAIEDFSVSANRTADLLFKTRKDGTLAERMRILAGGGLTFNGDTAAANALDDYEEGTWTPSDQSGAGLSFTTHYAKYVKIGRQLTVHLYLTYPSTSNGAPASIGGLPFAVESSGYAALFINCQLGAFCAQVQQSTTRVNIKNATNVHQLNSTLSGQFIIFSGSYVVA